MKILRVFGYFSYAAIPLGVMLWATTSGRINGFETFIQILFKVVVCNAAAMFLCVYGIQKIKGLVKYKLIQIDWVRALLQYLFYISAFFIIQFVIGIALLGNAMSGDDDIYPIMHR